MPCPSKYRPAIHGAFLLPNMRLNAPMFHDEAAITIKSGNGGHGCVSFRREKYIPEGGPDGGDGGKGGDVVFVASRHLNTLSAFVRKRKWKARNGEDGRSRNCHGKSGADLEIEVPLGTLVRHADTGELLADMCQNEQRVVIAEGGVGGRGNTYYKSSTNQTPRKAGNGAPGVGFPLNLELKLIADVGIIGFPNAGKSTLLSRLSAAKPKIASYPFTTLTPQLGVIEYDDRSIVMADIPGLIEGAAEGVGLGHQFLRHVERCAFLVHLVDASVDDAETLSGRIDVLNDELRRFSEILAEREQLLVLNKCDVRPEMDELANELKELRQQEVLVISGVSGEGLRALQNALLLRLTSTDE